MKKVYYIGKFQFDSFTEYKKGLEDVKKIKYITDEVDINEPGVAMRLYSLIRQKDIKFKSVIGEDYLLYLSDLVADDYKELSESDGMTIEGPAVNNIRKMAGIICMSIAVISFLCFLGIEYSDKMKTRQMVKLKDDQQISVVAQYIADKINGVDTMSVVTNEIFGAENEVQQKKKNTEQNKKLDILPIYAPTFQQNNDLVGWIQIDDTNIDYPVMQTKEEKGEDPQFYLDKNFNKEDSIDGSIFLDSRNDFINRDQNLIIYGHNMKSGAMFGSLKKYKDKDYYQSHKTIKFNTIYEQGVYEVVAVCMNEVKYQDEEVFKYYNFVNAKSQKDFNEFVANIENMNITGEAVNITMEDELLTISTCDSYIEDGRLFLVAKRVQ